MNYREEKIDEFDKNKSIEFRCRQFQEDFRSKVSELIYSLGKSTYNCVECKMIYLNMIVYQDYMKVLLFIVNIAKKI